MWKWIHRRDATVRDGVNTDAPGAEERIGRVVERSPVPGKYVPLHDYLKGRFADVVVLTFGQIEDILGFALPESARTQHEWWTTTDPEPDQSPCSAVWTLAGRTAVPNLLARTVVFERATDLSASTRAQRRR